MRILKRSEKNISNTYQTCAKHVQYHPPSFSFNLERKKNS